MPAVPEDGMAPTMIKMIAWWAVTLHLIAVTATGLYRSGRAGERWTYPLGRLITDTVLLVCMWALVP